MDNQYDFELSSLIYKHLTNSLTKEERKELDDFIASDKSVSTIIHYFENPQNLQERLSYLRSVDVDSAKQQVFKKYKQKKRKPFINALKYAAMLAVFSLISLYFFFPQINSKNNDRIVAYIGSSYKNDILPGEEQANLRLSNGTEVPLGKGKAQWVEADGSVLVERNGKLIYIPENYTINPAVLYNTLTVPEAGVYQLVLPDATKVWLNANTTIKYPVNFIGSERLVELQGEAYFEVTKDASRPFIVKTNGNEIRVLGTSFNVNSYDNTTTSTTLFTGKVSVNYNNNERDLEPGQMLIAKGNQVNVHFANLERAAAWKNGYFYFDRENITEVMQQLSRWYGISTVYKEEISDQKIGGSISRNVNLSEVLEMLKDVSNLTFQINGKQVDISNMKPSGVRKIHKVKMNKHS